MTELMAVTFNLDKAKQFYSMDGEGFGTGATVVVQGVGPMGLLHVVKSRILGAGDIIAIDGSTFRLEMAKRFGADYTINIREMTAEERIERVRELTDGRGADLVVECAGVAEAILEGLEMARRGGMYIVAGVFADVGEVMINPHRHLAARGIRLIGLTNHPPTAYLPSLKLIEKFKNTFPFDEFVTHEFGIEEAEAAMQQAFDIDHAMKVVIAP
ncbi:MAG: zinc-binding dehydrogenase [Candidatus Bipolaricaulia bacterium]